MGILDELKKMTRPYDDDDMLDDDMDMDMDEDYDESEFTRAAQPAQQQVPVAEPVMQEPIQQAAPVNTADEPVRNTSYSSFGMGSMGSMGSVGRKDSVEIDPKYRVVLVSPDDFNVATPIADHIRQGKAIVLNCENTDKDVARRIVDFLSGVAYALDGKISKAANNVYILAPKDVGVDEADPETDEQKA